jgi:S1-C subfamily serine protease
MFPDSSARRAGLSGVAIEEVTPGSAAETAGLRSYSTAGGREEVDVIVALDGQPVRSQADLRRLLAARAVGDRVRLAVERETGRAELEVVLQDVR